MPHSKVAPAWGCKKYAGMRGWKINVKWNVLQTWILTFSSFSFFVVSPFLVSFTNPLAASQVRRETCLELSLLILWHSFCHPGIPRIPPTGSWFLWLGWDCGWHSVIDGWRWLWYIWQIFSMYYISMISKQTGWTLLHSRHSIENVMKNMTIISLGFKRESSYFQQILIWTLNTYGYIFSII